MSGERVTIDGQSIDFRHGESILEAARRLGIQIPTLCFVDGLAPDGGCRLCLVDVDGGLRPHAACHTPVAAGMRVRTATDPLETLRRELLALLLSRHARGVFRANADGNALEVLLARYSIEDSSLAHHAAPASEDSTHPYLRYDSARCIVCRRCLHACEEIQGQFVYDVSARGVATHLVFGSSNRYLDSDCTACGACVDVCPTGAISDVDRMDPVEDGVTRSTCAYCGVGCGVLIESGAERVLRIRGAADASVNRGHLCAKGRYAHAYQHSGERLTTPLRREGDRFEPVSWMDAIGWLAGRLSELHRRFGSAAVGALTSSRSTNEAAYLLQKLFRTRFGSNHVDCCARVCHSSTALALGAQTGAGAASASFADIERARFIVVAGANPTEAHPIVGARIKQAALNGAGLIVIDPRRIELCDYASQHLALRPGTNVALQNGLAKLLLKEGAVDAAYLAERVEGFEELRGQLAHVSLDDVSHVTGIDIPDLERAARQVGRAGPVLFVHGLGLSELTQGTDSVTALCNLGLLTGSIGRPGAGMLPLRGQNNVQGCADMGSMPNAVTGYQALDDPAVRERLREIWGAAPPRAPGWTLPEMLDGAVRGELRGLWIQGEDIVQSDPNEAHVIEALQALDLLVVQELFLSETARFAHLILPAAGALEQDGTFTNAERRIQRVRRAVTAPGEARPDWEVIRDVAVALGERWSYASPAEVMDEIARVAPTLFGGVRYDRLERDGLQWPCPTSEHPGTPTLHADRFLRGKGRLVPVEFRASPEHDQSAFPYLLSTGRVLQHYNVGTMTRRTPSQELDPIDRLEIARLDADDLGIPDGHRVEIESRWGRTTAQAYRSDRMAPGRLFLSFHQPQTHTNRLTGPLRDPRSDCPDYKVIAVRLTVREGPQYREGCHEERGA